MSSPGFATTTVAEPGLILWYRLTKSGFRTTTAAEPGLSWRNAEPRLTKSGFCKCWANKSGFCRSLVYNPLSGAPDRTALYLPPWHPRVQMGSRSLCTCACGSRRGARASPLTPSSDKSCCTLVPLLRTARFPSTWSAERTLHRRRSSRRWADHSLMRASRDTIRRSSPMARQEPEKSAISRRVPLASQQRLTHTRSPR